MKVEKNRATSIIYNKLPLLIYYIHLIVQYNGKSRIIKKKAIISMGNLMVKIIQHAYTSRCQNQANKEISQKKYIT
jgi:hypothetical protein